MNCERQKSFLAETDLQFIFKHMSTLESNALISQSKKSLLSFCVFNNKHFEIWGHHIKLTRALDKVVRGETKRLLISVPPRHWKSFISSQYLPAYFLWHHPEKFVMLCSYSATLAESFSRRARDVMKQPHYQALFDTNFKEWAEQVKHRETARWWWMIASWVGWSITGKWFHLWIIDDPISNDEEANSDLIKEKIWDWYQSTFYTRQEKDARIVMIMTRWAEDDLVWRVLEDESKGGEKREHLKLPAISDRGEALRPEKYDIEKLEQIKRSIWPLKRNSLYQQDPVPAEWNYFKNERFQRYTKVPSDNIQIFSFLDPAISEKQTADYTAIVTIWVHQKTQEIFILDIFHERCNPDRIIDKVFELSIKYNQDKFGIEVVAYQKMLAQEITKEMRARNHYFVLEEVRPMWEKEARIKSTLQRFYSNKKIRHNFMCNWLESELLKFPRGKHDDLIDALSWAVKLSEPESLSSAFSWPTEQPRYDFL